MYNNILIPVSRTTNIKFLVSFINNFLTPGGEVTFFHVITTELFGVSPGEWRRAMSTISTTHLLSANLKVEINYRVKNSLSVATGIIEESKRGKYDLILFANSTYRKHLKHIFGNKVDDVIKRSGIDTIVLSYFDDRPPWI